MYLVKEAKIEKTTRAKTHNRNRRLEHNSFGNRTSQQNKTQQRYKDVNNTVNKCNLIYTHECGAQQPGNIYILYKCRRNIYQNVKE